MECSFAAGAEMADVAVNEEIGTAEMVWFIQAGVVQWKAAKSVIGEINADYETGEKGTCPYTTS